MTITSTIYVGGGSKYSTLQAAVRAAELSGTHAIVVQSGKYTGPVTLGSADNGLTISASGSATLTGAVTITGASGITLKGLAFSGQTVAVDAINSTAITVSGNRFSGTGEAVLFDGSSNGRVSGNNFANTGGSAIELKNGANQNTITSNVISGSRAPDTQGAIYLHGASNNQITHNNISNTTGSGISLSDFYGPGNTETQNNNNTVAYNKLINTDTASQDSGAIYVLGRSQNPWTGNVVKMNFISGFGPAGGHSAGIYLDDNASGVTVTSNVVVANSNATDAFEIHGGSNNTLSGNIFDLGTGSPSFGLLQPTDPSQAPQGSFVPLTNDRVQGNIFTTESTRPHDPGFADYTNGIGNLLISRNDYWAYSGAPLNVGGTDPAAQYNPPGAIGDYGHWTMAGFQPIDMSAMGIA